VHHQSSAWFRWISCRPIFNNSGKLSSYKYPYASPLSFTTKSVRTYRGLWACAGCKWYAWVNSSLSFAPRVQQLLRLSLCSLAQLLMQLMHFFVFRGLR
jgi:hypothetical protein